MTEFSDKQVLFISEFPIDLNGKQAAIRAGYSPKTAESQASRLLRNVKVRAAIEEKLQKRIEKTDLDAEFVLRQHGAIAKMSIRDIIDNNWNVKPLEDWPDIWCENLSAFDIQELQGGDKEVLNSFIKKFKWPDKLRNLELLGKHVDVSAYSENLKVHSEKSDEQKLIDKMAIAFSYEQCREVFNLQEKGASLEDAYNQVLKGK